VHLPSSTSLFGTLQEPTTPIGAKGENPLRLSNLRRLPSAFWWVVGIGGFVTLARFSEAFLILRVQEGGLAITLIPLVLIVFNGVYAATAYPFGHLSDRVNRRGLLAAGLVVLIAADLVLASSNQGVSVWIGIGLWGLHMGMTQGLLATLVAETAPAAWRGTAFGLFNFVSGIAMLIASVMAGLLWDVIGASATFIAGAVASAMAIALIAVTLRR
jgi:MFS family permease